MSTETPRPGLAETLLTALHADNGVYRYGAEEGADAALSWLSARLTDDDVVEAGARAAFADHTGGRDLHKADAEQGDPYLVDLWSGWARSALTAAAALIGGEA